MKAVTTSIVVLTHNKLDATRLCLPTLLAAADRDWELIVVDNGSQDGTVEWLESFRQTCAGHGVSVRVLRNVANVGCSTARNQGAAAARGSRLVFMDNDVAVRSRGWLHGLADRLEQDRRRVIVGPKLVYPTPPHAIQCAGVGIARSGRVQFRGRGQPRETPAFNREQEVQALISACCMVDRAAFEAAGGFREEFNPVEFEDFDLCYRLREAGGQAWYVPAVEMYHLESVTTAGTPSLPNTALIVRHGLLFKRHWRHRFEREDGPADAETRWQPIPPTRLDSLGVLPLID